MQCTATLQGSSGHFWTIQDVCAVHLAETGMSAEQPDNDVHEDMQLVLLQHIISGMNQSHQRQQISADKPDLQSDVMASLIQHLPGMLFSSRVRCLS